MTHSNKNKLATIARVVLGLVFTLSGLNHILGLVPMPAMTGATALFWHGLKQTGYFFPLLGCVEAAAGLLLLRGRLVPLALAMLAPIVVNVIAFHAVLVPQGLGVAALITAATITLARRHRAAFARLLAARMDATARPIRIVEVTMGLVFIASGIAGFLGRTPPPATPSAALMMQGLAAAGYFLPILCGVQVAAGALLVTGRYVGVALVALAPVTIEIIAYRLHAAAVPSRMMLVAIGLLAANAGLAFAHRSLFAPLARRELPEREDLIANV